MELKDLDPRNWLKKGSSAAVMDPPPATTPPPPQIMSAGSGGPTGGSTAVDLEGNGLPDKPGDPQPEASNADVKNSFTLEPSQIPEPNKN